MPEKPCPDCGTPMDVEPIVVLGMTVAATPICEKCSAKAAAEERPAALPPTAEDLIRLKLERIGVNVPAHGRFPLEHVLSHMPAPVVAEAKRFIADVENAGRWDPVQGLIFEGPTGVGKSLLAIAIARDFLERQVLQTTQVRYDRSRWLFGLVKSGYGDGTATAELKARMLSRLWILDDFGAEHATDDTAANLTDILSARELHPTIVTANVPREEQGDRWNSEFWDRIKSRLGDRNFRVVQIVGADRRLRAL